MSACAHLRIGWGSADLTPDKPVMIAGQFYVRVSEGVMDPITATALALESVHDGKPVDFAIMVSCDLVSIPDNLRDAVRAQLHKDLPELDPLRVFLNATHTHAGPDARVDSNSRKTDGGISTQSVGVALEELGVMDPADYAVFAAKKIVTAVAQAWKARAPGAIGFGLGQAVVGHNRLISYYNGKTIMCGKTNDPEFSHVEGYEDHAVNLLCTYDADKKLTGMIVNLACPAQISGSSHLLSADFWHDTRVELRRRLGAKLFVLPQCSAAGDQCPHVFTSQAAEARMLFLKGLVKTMPEKLTCNMGAPEAWRREIAERIADAVTAILPGVGKAIDAAPAFAHRVATVDLPRRSITRQDVDEASAEADKARIAYEALRRDLEAHPEKKKEPGWHSVITMTFRKMNWFKGVATRYEIQKKQPKLAVEIHILRLGDVAIATNPFEYYLDFGMQIKARSPAIQTFLVQLVGSATYLPTARAIAGKSYGASPASTAVGPEGGRELANKTVEIIVELWGSNH